MAPGSAVFPAAEFAILGGPVSEPLVAPGKFNSQVWDSRQSNTETERLTARSAVAMLPIWPVGEFHDGQSAGPTAVATPSK